MGFSATVTPGKTYSDGELVTYAGLNLLGLPTITLAGTIGTNDLENGAVTEIKLADGAVTNSKLADRIVTLAKHETGDPGTIMFWDSGGIPQRLMPGNENDKLTLQLIDGYNQPRWRPDTEIVSVQVSQIAKGANDTQLETDSSGNVVWANKPVQIGQTAVLWEQQNNGTHAGTFTQDTDVKRTLNQETDPDNIVTVASSVMTVAAGTYHIQASAPGYDCDYHVIWIQDTTAGAAVINGSATYSDSSSAEPCRSVLEGVVTFTVPTDLELRHRCTATKSSTGLGRAVGSMGGDTSHPEVYSLVKITKIG